MKNLFIIAVLTLFFTASTTALAQNNGVKPFFSPPTFTTPQPMTPPAFSYGGQNQAYTGQNRTRSRHIWVTPDYETHKQDLRDQESWASPEPDPGANDPRNYMQPRAKPRGYIIQY